MKRKKFLYALVTTLVLFSIIRTTSQCQKDTTEPIEVEKEISEEDLDKGEPSPSTGSVTIKIREKPKIEPVEKEIEVPDKKLDVETPDSGDRDPSLSYRVKSNKAYFKVVKGYAFIGGDILLGKVSEEQKEELEGKVLTKELRPSRLWPNSTIPYGISENLTKLQRKQVKDVVSYLNSATILKLVPLVEGRDKDAIVFERREELPCASYLGRTGGFQPIFLSEKNCGVQGAVHEVLHALGFVHEQQREERDEEIEVLWDNIEIDYAYNFSLLPDALLHPYEGSVFDIDLTSIMMYSDVAFAKAGLKSMKSLSNRPISPVKIGLSENDVERIYYLYGS